LLPSITEEKDSNEVWVNMRPFSLNLWLQGLTSNTTNKEEEICYGISR